MRMMMKTKMRMKAVNTKTKMTIRMKTRTMRDWAEIKMRDNNSKSIMKRRMKSLRDQNQKLNR
jgi:hypothetical protein